MLQRIVTGSLLLDAIIHLLPISGFLSVSRLASLYGIAIDDANLEILMRHRAVLFGILGMFIAYAAFQPYLQAYALMAGFASVVSFFYLSYTVGGFNSALQKVVIADVVALVALIIALGCYLYSKAA